MLRAIRLHKIIIEKTQRSIVPIFIEELIAEMNTEPRNFEAAMKILDDLRLITINPRKGTITLTPTGALANIDHFSHHEER